jgi:HPt (histidine-containing phosphotransfer) domain-containing protein
MPDKDTAVFDANKMLANIGGDVELFHQLIRLFLDRHRTMVHDIKSAIGGGDNVRLQRAAHTMKGTVANLCATEVLEVASQLEAAGRLDTLEEVPALVLQLERAVQRLVEVLSREIRPV